MSTKMTVRYAENRYHLYVELSDYLGGPDPNFVCLELDTPSFEAEVSAFERGRLTVRIPMDVARELGLMPGDADNGSGERDE